MARRLTDTYFVIFYIPVNHIRYEQRTIYKTVIIIPEDVVNPEDYIYTYIHKHYYISSKFPVLPEEAHTYINILNIKPL